MSSASRARSAATVSGRKGSAVSAVARASRWPRSASRGPFQSRLRSRRLRSRSPRKGSGRARAYWRRAMPGQGAGGGPLSSAPATRPAKARLRPSEATSAHFSQLRRAIGHGCVTPRRRGRRSRRPGRRRTSVEAVAVQPTLAADVDDAADADPEAEGRGRDQGGRHAPAAEAWRGAAAAVPAAAARGPARRRHGRRSPRRRRRGSPRAAPRGRRPRLAGGGEEGARSASSRRIWSSGPVVVIR